MDRVCTEQELNASATINTDKIVLNFMSFFFSETLLSSTVTIYTQKERGTFLFPSVILRSSTTYFTRLQRIKPTPKRRERRCLSLVKLKSVEVFRMTR